MNRSIKSVMLAGAACALLLGTTNAIAQQQRGQGGQGRGNFDPAEMRQRMMEQLQEQLGMSADEFKAVQPLIEAATTKQTELNSFRSFGAVGRGRGGGGPGGGGGGRGFGGFGGTPAPETEALQKAVESGTPSEIKAKIEALRSARTKKEAELKEAREKLRKVVTAKQEAQLVLRGTLD